MQEALEQLRAQIDELLALNRAGEALPLARELVERSESLLGKAHGETGRHLATLGLVLLHTAQPQEAIQVLLQAVERLVGLLGEESDEVFETQCLLSAAYQMQGDAGEAISLMARVLDARERVSGLDDPSLVDVTMTLGLLKIQAGRPGEAVADFAQGFRVAARNGALAATYREWRDTLYGALSRLDDLDLEQRVLGQVLDALRAEEADSQLTPYILMRLASGCRDKGRHKEAIRYVEELLAMHQASGDLAGEASCREQLADCWEALGQGDKAAALRRHALGLREEAWLRKAAGYPDEPRFQEADFQEYLASWFRQELAGLPPVLVRELLKEVRNLDLTFALKDAPAETAEAFLGALFERASAMVREDMRYLDRMPEHIVAAARAAILGTVPAAWAGYRNTKVAELAGNGGLDDPAALAGKVLAELQELPAGDALEPLHLLYDLAHVYVQEGRKEAARKYLDAALENADRDVEGASCLAAFILRCQGKLLRAIGDLAGFRAVLERALDVADRAVGPAHPVRTNIMLHLAAARRLTGDWTGAKALFSTGVQLIEQALDDHGVIRELYLHDWAEAMAFLADYTAGGFVFEHIKDLDDSAVAELLKEIPADSLFPAHKGASQTLRERIRANVSPALRNLMTECTLALGPVRLQDVRKAQAEVVRIALRLVEQGRLCPGEGDAVRH